MMNGSEAGRAGSNPFVGPWPIARGQRLYGRDLESQELADRLHSERIILLHAPSGAGKTSLVEAGLRPLLSRSFDIWGPTRVNLEPAGGGNRYIESAIRGFEQGVPERLRGRAGTLDDLEEYFEERPRRRSAPPNTLLIFDQFEEVLTVDPLATEAKRHFFERLGELLRNRRIWALFVLREDYLAPLHPYEVLVPTHLQNRFRIDLLGRKAAIEAGQRIAADGGRRFPAAEQLVRDLATVKVQAADGTFSPQIGDFVEPVQLQVVCRRLWDAMPAEDLEIDSRALQAIHDVTDALAGYYRETAAAVSAGSPLLERQIRQWFGEQLITEAGSRRPVLRGPEDSGGLANETIEALRQAHLVRAERRGGAIWYELAHDRLLDPVLVDNTGWFERHLHPMQRQARSWERESRPDRLLLRKRDLGAALEWARENEELVLPIEKLFLRECRNQRAGERRRVAVWAVIGLLLVAGLLFADKLRRDAEHRAAVHRAHALVLAAPEASDPLVGALLLLEAGELGDEVDAFEAVRSARRVLASTPPQSVLRPPREEGRQRELRSAAFSPDGKLVVTASFDGTAHLWRADGSGAPIELRGHDREVRTVLFGPEGSSVVTTSADGTARTWGLDGRAEQSLDVASGCGGVCYALDAAFDAAGDRLVTTSSDGKAVLWIRGPSGEWTRGETLAGERFWGKGWIWKALFRPGTSQIVTVSNNDAAPLILFEVGVDEPSPVSLFDPDDWKTRAKNKAYRFTDGHFTPDGRTLVVSAEDGTLWIVAADERGVLGEPRELARIDWPAEGKSDDSRWSDRIGIHGLDMAPDGESIATASLDGLARVWSLRNEDPVSREFQGHRGAVWDVRFDEHGARLLTAGDDGTARLLNVDGSGRPFVLRGHRDRVRQAVFGPGGERLVTVSRDGSARVWRNPRRGEQVVARGSERVPPPPARLPSAPERTTLWSAAEDPLGDGALAAMDDGFVYRLEPTGWVRLKAVAYAQGEAPEWGDVEPDGTRVVADRWLHLEHITQVASSPTSELFVTVSADGTARVWSAESEDPEMLIEGGRPVVQKLGEEGSEVRRRGRIGHARAVTWAEFHPGGKRLATLSEDGTVLLWDLEDPSRVPELLAWHEQPVTAAEFSRDGAAFVTASQDGAARVWQVGGEREPIVLHGHDGPLTGASFSPEGTRVETAADRTLRTWLISWPLLLDHLLETTAACLEPGRRISYLEETGGEANDAYARCMVELQGQ